MSGTVARVTEISARSDTSFEDAVRAASLGPTRRCVASSRPGSRSSRWMWRTERLLPTASTCWSPSSSTSGRNPGTRSHAEARTARPGGIPWGGPFCWGHTGGEGAQRLQQPLQPTVAIGTGCPPSRPISVTGPSRGTRQSTATPGGPGDRLAQCVRGRSVGGGALAQAPGQSPFEVWWRLPQADWDADGVSGSRGPMSRRNGGYSSRISEV